MQFMTSVNCMYSDSVQIQSTAQGEEKSPAHNRWRSVSLFGMSANTWRDFYRSGAMLRSCEPSDRMSHHITGNKQEHTVRVVGASRCPPSNCQHLCWHFSRPLCFISIWHPGWLLVHISPPQTHSHAILVPTYNHALPTTLPISSPSFPVFTDWTDRFMYLQLSPTFYVLLGPLISLRHYIPLTYQKHKPADNTLHPRTSGSSKKVNMINKNAGRGHWLLSDKVMTPILAQRESQDLTFRFSFSCISKYTLGTPLTL